MTEKNKGELMQFVKIGAMIGGIFISVFGANTLTKSPEVDSLKTEINKINSERNTKDIEEIKRNQKADIKEIRKEMKDGFQKLSDEYSNRT
mgnify:CR=1 FL=1